VREYADFQVDMLSVDAPNKQPSKTDLFKECVTQTLTPALQGYFQDWKKQAKRAPLFGVGTGAVVTVGVVASEPYLLPTAPALFLLTSTSTTVFLTDVATTRGLANAAGGVIGATYGCAGGTF